MSKFPRRGGLVLIHRPRLFRVVNALLDREEGATMTAIRFLQEVDGLAVPRQLTTTTRNAGTKAFSGPVAG